MILRFGGSFFFTNNIQNNNGFEYFIEAVSAKVFGFELYPGIYRKAAFYMFSIISNHIFFDGNKRTGLASALLYLRKNNLRMKSNLKSSDITDFTFKVAKSEISLDEMETWFINNFEYINYNM